MTYEQALTLTPHESFVRFAEANYRFAGLYSEDHFLRRAHLLLYDEPPTQHIDSILIKDCDLVHEKELGSRGK